MSKLTAEHIKAFNARIYEVRFEAVIVLHPDGKPSTVAALYRKHGWLVTIKPDKTLELRRPPTEGKGPDWTKGYYCALSVASNVSGNLHEAVRSGGKIEGVELGDRITLAKNGYNDGLLPDPNDFDYGGEAFRSHHAAHEQRTGA